MGDRRDGVRRVQGISRRELIRRGAVVGGTLLWATPVVQSLAPAANAFHARYATCCECNGASPQCAENHITFEECAAFCGGESRIEAYLVGDYNCINTHCTPA
jgi:hypothetical protein